MNNNDKSAELEKTTELELQQKNSQKPSPLIGTTRFSYKMLIFFALIFVGIGTYLVLRSLASTPLAEVSNFEASGELEVVIVEGIIHKNKINNTTPAPEPIGERMGVKYEYYIKASDGKRYELLFPEDPQSPNVQNKGSELLGGSKVKVRGRKNAENTITMASSGGEDLAITSAATTATLSQSPKVAVILFNFKDDTSQPNTIDEARDIVFGSSANSVKSYYQRNSYGKFDITGNVKPEGDVFGWITINQPKSAGCRESLWADEADGSVAASGVDISAYQHIIYSFPHVSACGWGGKAHVPGSRSWNNIRLTADVATHEIGHNLSLRHANGFRCKDPLGFYTDTSESCQSLEYYDDFDVMGNSSTPDTQDLNAYHKLELGWLPATNIQNVNASGEFTLNAIGQSSDGVQVLLIPRVVYRKSVLDYYYVEYRQNDNLDSLQPPGVLVHRGYKYDELGYNNSNLIDTTAESSYNNNFLDAPLAIGRTFTDGSNNVTITPISSTAGQAKIRVTLGATRTSPPDNASCITNIGPDGVTPKGPDFNATITMKNTGTTTWNTADYELGSISNPTGLWGRRGLALSGNVPPGGTAAFSASFAPPGGSIGDKTRGFNWRMIKKSSSDWFGQPCIKPMAVNNYPAAPGVPGGLITTAISPSSATLKWTPGVEGAGASATRHKILRASGQATYLAGISSSVAGTYTDNGVKPGATYVYSIVTISQNGLESAPSQPITVKIPRR